MQRQLLSDPDDWMSTQGSGIIGSTPSINHSLGLQGASKALQSQAYLRATQFRNDAAKEMAENKMPAPVQQQQPGWMGLANTAVRGLPSILGAIRAGNPGSNNYDFSSPMWTGAQQDFSDFYNSGAGVADAFSFGGGTDLGGFGADVATSGIDFSGAWDGSIW